VACVSVRRRVDEDDCCLVGNQRQVDREVALIDCVNPIDRGGHRAQRAANRATAVRLGKLSSRRQRQTISAQRRAAGDTKIRITVPRQLFALQLGRLLGAEQAAQLQSKQLSRNGYANLGVTSGATLRTYRLALAATAEFTQTYGGGTVGGALSAMTTTINGVNAIYERDLAIHLTLVANETAIIFINSATDGYTSD